MLQIFAQQGRPGVIRSELQPEETCGLTRSGDLSRMLPFEAHLLAAGWQAQDDAESQTSVAGMRSPPVRCLNAAPHGHTHGQRAIKFAGACLGKGV